MATLSIAARRVGLVGVLAVLFALLFASPAAAHADLRNITRRTERNWTRRRPRCSWRSPSRSTWSTAASGWSTASAPPCPLPTSTVDGKTVNWPMPADLPKGAYVVTWRVVSSDGHPISGASSSSAPPRPPCRPRAQTQGPLTPPGFVATGWTAPWPVVVMRLAGYIAFALFAGVAAFVLLCAPDTATISPCRPWPARGSSARGRRGRRHPGPRPVHGRSPDEPCLRHTPIPQTLATRSAPR